MGLKTEFGKMGLGDGFGADDVLGTWPILSKNLKDVNLKVNWNKLKSVKLGKKIS